MYDPLLEVYYARARMYDAGDRRFMAEDLLGGSIAEPQTLNPYVYVINNPTRYFDPFGLIYTIYDRPANQYITTDNYEIAEQHRKAGYTVTGLDQGQAKKFIESTSKAGVAVVEAPDSKLKLSATGEIVESIVLKPRPEYVSTYMEQLVCWVVKVGQATWNSVSLEIEYGAGIGVDINIANLIEPGAKLAVNENVNFSTKGIDRNWGTDFEIGFTVFNTFGVKGSRRVITPYSSGPNYNSNHPNYDSSTGLIYEDEITIIKRINIKNTSVDSGIDKKGKDTEVSIGADVYFGFGGGISLKFNFSEFRRQYSEIK
jgi:RHS repeat-associated protein